MNLNADEIDILERVVSKPALQPVFFRKVKGLKWFDALASRDFFNPYHNPKPIPADQEGYVNIPTWPITEYLVNTSEELSLVVETDYSLKFLELMRSCTLFAESNLFSNYRTWWQFSKIIKQIPVNLIMLNDVQMIEYWLKDPYERSLVADELGENWLTVLLKNADEHSHKLAIKLIEILFRVEIISSNKGFYKKEARLIIKEWYAKKIASKIIPTAGKVLKQEVVDIFKGSLEVILSEFENDTWSSVWRAAIEEHEQNHSRDDTEDVILEAFRDSLLAWISIEPKVAGNYVDSLFKSKYQTLKRIAIHVVDVKYSELNGLVNNVILNRNFNSNLRHELWNFLNHHFVDLIIDQQNSVLNSIYGIVELDDKDIKIERSTAYQQAIWLSAIKDTSTEITQKYLSLIQIAGSEPEHPSFASYSTSGWVGHKSPFSREVLLSFTVEDLILELNKFEGDGEFDSPDIEGLANEFKESVKSLPLNFYNHFNKFVVSNHPYIHSLISAYKELWLEKAQLPWDDIWLNLLNFIKLLVEDKSFWVEIQPRENRQFYANRNWIVSLIGDLIEVGTKSDDHAFDESLLSLATEILLIVLDNQDGESFYDNSDAISIAINSPRGHCIQALINLVLRSCRLRQARGESHDAVWSSFQPIFDSELLKSRKGNFEFITLVTRYLPNFLYMSDVWIMQNLNKIFDKNNYKAWLCAMQGYSSTNTVYEQVYKFLALNGHFISALDDDNFKDRVDEIIIQHIVVAYLNDYERLDDPSSLISQILVRSKFNELGWLIWFIWLQRDNKDTKLTQKVFEIWPKLIYQIKIGTAEGKKLASKLCTWAIFISEVTDENRKLLMDILPYANEDYNSHDLMKNVARISEKQPVEAYHLWEEILITTMPDYPPEDIKRTLLNIRKSGADGQRQAKSIASKYIAKGNDQLAIWLKG